MNPLNTDTMTGKTSVIAKRLFLRPTKILRNVHFRCFPKDPLDRAELQSLDGCQNLISALWLDEKTCFEEPQDGLRVCFAVLQSFLCRSHKLRSHLLQRARFCSGPPPLQNGLKLAFLFGVVADIVIPCVRKKYPKSGVPPWHQVSRGPVDSR